MAKLVAGVRRKLGRLVAGPPAAPPPSATKFTAEPAPPPDLPGFPAAATTRLLVGPANFAGQGQRWARAADEHLGGVASVCFAYERGAFSFPVDLTVPLESFRSAEWAALVVRSIQDGVTHVLVEGMRAVTGPRYGPDCWGELPVLRAAGAAIALVGHGSEVRSPRRIAAEEPGSAFDDPDDPEVAAMQARADRTAAMVDCFGGPVFVSTPDLAADLPGATWLPVVVEPDRWVAPRPALERERPVLLAAPTHPRFKGIDGVMEGLAALEAEGAVELRLVDGVPPQDMPALVAGADIVLDQFLVGGYGLAAVEAMAAGRLVVGHVSAAVRDAVGDVPIVESSATDLIQTLRAVLDDRDRFAVLAAAGPGFVRSVHDGRRAAEALVPFLHTG